MILDQEKHRRVKVTTYIHDGGKSGQGRLQVVWNEELNSYQLMNCRVDRLRQMESVKNVFSNLIKVKTG